MVVGGDVGILTIVLNAMEPERLRKSHVTAITRRLVGLPVSCGMHWTPLDLDTVIGASNDSLLQW